MVDNEVKIRILTQEDLIAAGCFNVESSINICEQAFCDYADGNVILPDKISVIFNQESQDRINCLPAAITTEKIYGMKWVSVFPENPRLKNLSNLTAVILLSELESGFPIAFMEGGTMVNTTEMLALNIYKTFYVGASTRGIAQAKAVIFFILVAVIALAQLKATRQKEVQQ